MNKLINSTNDFGVLWTEDYILNNRSFGKIQIIIGENIYPSKPDNAYTLQTVFFNLKDSFLNKYYPSGNTGNDFGEKKFNLRKWNDLQLNDIFDIETSELSGGTLTNQLIMCMGYSGETERLFYSFDNGKKFNEIRFKKGTIENIIFSLPTY